MKKFKYRLEALLKVKEHVEKERQKEHAQAVQGVQNQKDALARLDQTKLDTLNKQRDVMQGTMSVAEMLVYGRYLQKLKREKIGGEEVLTAFEKMEKKRREKLLEAARERQIQEKLKEKQFEKHYDAILDAEIKETDEIASNNYRLKSSDQFNK
jgi:flagellar FliJ protein